VNDEQMTPADSVTPDPAGTDPGGPEMAPAGDAGATDRPPYSAAPPVQQAWGGWTAPPPGPPAPGWGYQPPWGPPPGFSALGYPAPPPPPPPLRTSRTLSVATFLAMAAAIVLLAGGGGTALGFALRGSTPTTTQSPSASGGTTLTPSGNSGSTATPSGGSTGADLSGIPAVIDPTIVDVNDVLEGDEGTAAGTGIILTSTGEVLTNNHVIEGASSITVQVDGQGTNYTAKVVGYDPADDIAVVQIQNASGLATTPLGDSSTVKVGDPIVAIGNALGAGGTPAAVTGTVTGLDQSITATDGQSSEALSGMIQIQANIQRGDSGGPLVNAAGKVIGIDTAGSENGNGFGTQSTGTTGFALPIDTALSIASRIEAGDSGGNIHIGSGGPFIGISVEDVSASLTSPATSGALIAGVQAGSPAAAAGLVTGDVITSFNGSTITSTGDLSTALKPLRPGDTVQIGWMDSSGQSHTASLKLASGAPL